MVLTREDLEKKLFVTNEYGYRHQIPTASLDEDEIEFAGKTWGIDTTLHRTCINCQVRQQLKYEYTKDNETGQNANKFLVPCSGIPKHLPASAEMLIENMEAKGIPYERALRYAQSTVDPVAWAELMFGLRDTDPKWSIRPYQKEQIRCTSRRIVVREGRRAGKALWIKTKIPSPNGWTTMEDLEEGSLVFDETGKPCKVTFVTDVMYDHPCYKVEFDDGSEIIADAEHTWSVQTKSMRKSNARNKTKRHGLINLTTEDMIKNLKVGKKNESNYSIPITKPLSYTSSDIELLVHPYVLGYWLGDGTRGTSYVTIGLQDQNESLRNINACGYTTKTGYSSEINCGIPGLITKLKRLGIHKEKRIPAQYLRASVNQRLELLKGLMDSDGSALTKGTCEFTSSDPELADDVFELIISLGFKASKNIGESWFDGERYKDRTRIYFNPPVNVFKLTRKANRIEDKTFGQSNRYITAITKVESVPVKCITVDSPNHLYLAGEACIPTHNTFAMAIKLLERAFNMKVAWINSEGEEEYHGPKIMIITPYQNQLTNIFNEMESLLKRNKDLCKSVTSGSNDALYIKSPQYKMAFDNGAEIGGFISGVGLRHDGNGGASMRGQSAHIIYLDEMDFIPEDVLEKVVKPILMSDIEGNTMLFATSTPSGKKGHFYKWCMESPRFKEDYLPSSVLPQWNKIKYEMIGDATKEAIEAEYMASFVDSNYGVFKASFIARSRKDYTYEDCNDSKWWKDHFAVTSDQQVIRCIGIDWNKNAGTEFVVVTYIPHLNRYIVSEAINISAGEFSALRWQEELIRLNYKWRPDYIYADEGYGELIIENLHLLALELSQKKGATLREQETAKIRERLKSFNFSKNLVLRNPVDGKEIIKYGKSFLVEMSKRVFEDPGQGDNGILWIPEAEKVLLKQLAHYVQLKLSSTTNKPVYGTDSPSIGDHRLDAFMLAIGGIQIESGLFSPKRTANSIPTYLSKDELDERAETTFQSPGEMLIDNFRKTNTAAPGAFTLLQTMRQGETPEQAASRNGRGDRIQRRVRGREEQEPELVKWSNSLPVAGDPEYSRQTTSSHIIEPRRRSDRGWRKQ